MALAPLTSTSSSHLGNYEETSLWQSQWEGRGLPPQLETFKYGYFLPVARHLVISCKQTLSRKSNAGVNWPPPQISSNICIYYIDLYHLLCSYPAFPALSLSTFKQGSRSARSSCISCFKSSISRTASRHQEWQAQNATIRCGLGGSNHCNCWSFWPEWMLHTCSEIAVHQSNTPSKCG